MSWYFHDQLLFICLKTYTESQSFWFSPANKINNSQVAKFKHRRNVNALTLPFALKWPLFALPISTSTCLPSLVSFHLNNVPPEKNVTWKMYLFAVLYLYVCLVNCLQEILFIDWKMHFLFAVDDCYNVFHSAV